MPEWVETLPWGKIGAGVGALALTIGGGIYKGTVDETLETAKAPTVTQQEMMLRHFDWQTSCPVIAENAVKGVWVRECPSDNSRMYIDIRGGLQRIFFAVAPAEIPPAPILLGSVAPQPFFDLPGAAVYAAAPYTCLASHGEPAAFTDGADLGNGWVWQHLFWRDGCRMSRQFHRPTQSATAFVWDICVDYHY
jgi:hypothetical protein